MLSRDDVTSWSKERHLGAQVALRESAVMVADAHMGREGAH